MVVSRSAPMNSKRPVSKLRMNAPRKVKLRVERALMLTPTLSSCVVPFWSGGRSSATRSVVGPVAR